MNGLALRLQVLRGLAGGMSQRHLAKLAEMSPCYPGYIERSRREPGLSSRMATRVCAVFGCTFDYLVNGKGAPPSQGAVQGSVAAFERELARLARLAATKAATRAAAKTAARTASLRSATGRPRSTARSA